MRRIIQWTLWPAIALFLTINPFLSWNANKEIGMGYYNLGVIQMMNQKPNEAIESFERGIQASPNSPAMLLNLGVLYAQQGRFQESNRLFERVLEIDPDNINAIRNLEINQRRME